MSSTTQPLYKEQSIGIWVCNHPYWVESSRYASYLGNTTDGIAIPADVLWTAVEYCPICQETRLRPIDAAKGGVRGE